jgi:hypothetical protein
MNSSNNALIQFLQETLLRFSTKSPRFFQIWQYVSGALVLITGLPQLLELMNVHLPELWSANVNTAVAWASRGLFLMALMTTQSSTVAVDASSNILKKTNEAKLPFTATQEVKQLQKQSTIPEMSITNRVSTK